MNSMTNKQMAELEKLITEYGNRSFDCGAWEDETTLDADGMTRPYRSLVESSSAAKMALFDIYAAALEEVAQARELLRECERRMEYSGFPDCAGGIRYRIAKFLDDQPKEESDEPEAAE